jgi:hypothetical protein
MVPDQAGRHLLPPQVAVDGIVAEPFAVVCEVRQRIVDLADQPILAVIETSHSFFHDSDSIASSTVLPPNQFTLA